MASQKGRGAQGGGFVIAQKRRGAPRGTTVWLQEAREALRVANDCLLRSHGRHLAAAVVIATLVGLRLGFWLGLGVVAGGLAAADVVELGALLDAEEGLDELRQFGAGLQHGQGVEHVVGLADGGVGGLAGIGQLALHLRTLVVHAHGHEVQHLHGLLAGLRNPRLDAQCGEAASIRPLIETGVLFDLYFTPTSHQMGNTLSCRSPSLLVSSNRRELLHHHPRH